MAGLLSGALGNDGATNATGIAGPFVPNDRIQMVTQDLKIVIHDDYTDFEVTYLFRNHGVKTTVGMAFPVEGYNFGLPVIERFESLVDGRKVPVRYQMVKQDAYDDIFEARYYKRVIFETNQSRNVVVRYRAKNGMDSAGTLYVSYLLEPGSTWKGKLDWCKISIDWSNVSDDRNAFAGIRAVDADWTLTDDLPWKRTGPYRLDLELRDYEPRGILSIGLPTGFTRIRVNGTLVPFEAFDYLVKPIQRGEEVLIAGFGTMYGEKPGDLPEHELIRRQLAGLLGHEALILADDGQTLKSKSGKEFVLRRRSEIMSLNFGAVDEADRFEYIYLRDLVEALGGFYHYNPRSKEVLVTLRRPAAEPIRSQNARPS